MLARLRHTAIRLAVLGLYLLAAVGVGVAHRQHLPGGIDLAAYALPDGTLPVICLTDDAGAPATADTHQRCDACVLASAPGLALPAADGLPVPAAGKTVVHRPIARQTVAAIDHARPAARGPPSAHA